MKWVLELGYQRQMWMGFEQKFWMLFVAFSKLLMVAVVSPSEDSSTADLNKK